MGNGERGERMRDERANTITTEINYGRFAVERFAGYLRRSRPNEKRRDNKGFAVNVHRSCCMCRRLIIKHILLEI